MIGALDNIGKDSFSFEMEDIYRTGDEIEVLAETFDDITMLGIRWHGTNDSK